MNTRKYSSKQEKRVAKDIGGKVTSNSGATRFYKGDISTDSMLTRQKKFQRQEDLEMEKIISL